MDFLEKIANTFDSFVDTVSVFFRKVLWFFDDIVSVLSYIWSILKAVWFWMLSLLSWVWDLLKDVFSWSVFYNVWDAFSTLSNYIWWTATVFLSTLILVIIFRIIIAFVFKFFRLNVDYSHHNNQRSSFDK